MQRIKSIDSFRGLSMLWIVVAHLLNWWLISEDFWYYSLMASIFDVLGASSFLFISGVSSVLFYKNQQVKELIAGNLNKRYSKNIFLLRGLILLVIALLYNIPIAIYTQNAFDVWIWYVLLTISVSILLSWPLIKTSKITRFIIVLIFLILNQMLLQVLIPFQNKNNFFGILFHILYNGYPIMDPIMIFFPFFLMGTIIGDIIFDIYLQENENRRKLLIKKNLLTPMVLMSPIWITFGILYDFPSFLMTRTLSWTCYTIGIQILLLSLMIYIEEKFSNRVKKNYRFLFYFSSYSLTIFIVHNLLFFIFLRSLSYSFIFIFILVTILFIGLILGILYHIFGKKLSIKYWINFFSTELAKKIEDQYPSIE